MSESRPTRGKILVFLFVALIVIPSSVILTRKVQAELFKAEVTAMQKQIETMKMKTMCIGRFLIDVPEEAEVSFRGAFLSGWNIVSYPDESDAQFTARVQAQEEKIKGEKNGKGLASLESVTEINHDGLHGKIFIFGRVWTSGFDGRNTLSWVNVAVKGFVRTGGISFNLTSDDRAPESANDLAQLVTQIKPLAEGEIPPQSGFCFERGIVVDPLTADDGESVTMFVGLKGHPDLSIALHTAAGRTPAQTLLERDAPDDPNDIKQQYRSHFHTFRQGAHAINGIAGQELLERVTELNGVILHDFMWESFKNNKDSVLTPFISFEMSTGNGRPGRPVNASFSDAQAVALWDKISSSLRLRPTKVAQPAAAAAPLIEPLGVGVSANQACPASGWWRCDDGDGFAVLGGDTQYFRIGERVPQAVLLGPPTLWQRIRGERHRFQRSADTRWKLVERRLHGRVEPARTPAQADSRSDPIPISEAGDDEGERVRVPVGTLAGTGQPCPESGWWTCPETGALDGARWFVQGEVLPAVRFKASRTWLERWMGDPAVHSTRSVWQLARHDAEPPLMAAAANGADSLPAMSSHTSDDGAASAHPASSSPEQEA